MTQTSRLKFGMLMFPIHNPAHDPTLQLAQDIQLAEHADRLGFDEFWFGEHHSGGWQIVADPLLMVARAAATTSRIRLGTGVSTLAYHHPKMLLESAIQLDHMTRGRFMFGVGAGALALDSLMMGLDPMKARGAMEESLEAMMLLLAGGPVTYTPQHASWRLVDAYLQLQPYSEALDIRVAVFNSASGPRLAGRWGLGMVSFGTSAAVGLGKENRMAMAAAKAQYKADEYGQVLDRSRWSAMSPMHLAPTEAQARAEVRFGLRLYIDYIQQILPMNVPVDSDLDNIIDTLHLVGHGVVGTPEMAIKHIDRLQELSGGVGTFPIEHADWANFEHSKASMALFAREVVPHFSGSTRARTAAHARELQHDQLTRRTMAKAQAAAELEHSREVAQRRQTAARAQAIHDFATQTCIASSVDPYALATQKYKNGDKQGAIADYDRAIALNPNYAEAYNNRGITKSNLGDKQAAITDFNLALKINPDYAEAYGNRGIIKSNLGDKQAGITDFNLALKINPDYAEAYGSRGVAKADLGDKKGGIIDLGKAAELFRKQNRIDLCNKAMGLIKKIGG